MKIKSTSKVRSYTLKILSLVSVLALTLCLLVIPSSATDESAEDSVLIKAGTYRFNDTISIPSDSGWITINIPFTVSSTIVPIDTFVTVVCDNINTTYNETSGILDLAYNVISSTPDLGSDLEGDAYVYSTEENGWKRSIYGDGVQCITVTADTYVDDTSGTWFTSNTQRLGEEESPETCPTLKDYLDEFNDTTINGLPYTEGEAFLDYLLDNDIDLYDSLWDALVGNLSVDELRLGNPELYTDIYRFAFGVGDEAGYNRGYNQAADDFSETYVGDVVGGVFDALDRFTLFGGYSILDLIKTIVGIFAVVWLLKLLAGG